MSQFYNILYSCRFKKFLSFLFVGQRDFRVLLQDVQVSRCNAFAQGSYSNLRTQVRTYFAFCVFFGRQHLPADSTMVVSMYAYAQFLSRSLKPPSVRNYLSGVKMLHILHGLPYPHSQDALLQLQLRGICRLNPHVPVRARPVTPDILLAFHRLMDDEDSLHRCVWACSLFLFYLMARMGSILPTSTSTPRTKFLTRERVNFSIQGLLVTLLHTKTIQFGKRRLHIPLLKINSVLCPFAAYSRLFMSAPHITSVSGPAFTFSEDGHTKMLTTSKFIRTFRKVLTSV